MRIYVASAVDNAKTPEFQKVIHDLEAIGLTIACKWWEYDIDPNDPIQARKHADRLIDALDSANLFLLVLPGKMGSHFEMGYAASRPCSVYVYSPPGAVHAGEYPCVFHQATQVEHVTDWRQWLFLAWCDWTDDPIVIKRGYACICGRSIPWASVNDENIPNELKCSCGVLLSEWYDDTLIVDGAPMEEIEAWFYANRCP